MTRVRAALFLDFDNVFGGLFKLDPTAAVAFAETPELWMDRLATSFTVDGERTWLVRRCYMNPSGWVPTSDPGSTTGRVYFSRFRASFTRAGFEVVDCPSLTHRSKNAADIRMVLDAMDALVAPTRYDEFVIASGDSDMTPLMVRLRAADRRTTIVSPADAAQAFTAIADLVVGGDETVGLIQDPAGVDEPHEAASDPEAVAEALARFREIVTGQYDAAHGPLNLATLAHDLRRELGDVVSTSQWFGHGGFTRALESLDLPGMQVSQIYMWDGSRYETPRAGAPATYDPTLPEPVGRLCAELTIPRLPRATWPEVYRALADYAGSHDFNLTEATRWSRDTLSERGLNVSRSTLGFVTRGAAYGGSPLYRTPPPTADDVATAFVGNILDRAAAAEVALGEDEVGTVKAWFGFPGSPGQPGADGG